MGCVIDGCPPGLGLSQADIQKELLKRRPAQGAASSARNEADVPEILSGVFNNTTLGTPIAIVIRNTNCNPAAYDNLEDIYRSGHADWTYQAKYGIRDHRGGGRSSGRETVSRVAAGAVAKIFLAQYGISINAWVSSIFDIAMPCPGESGFDCFAKGSYPALQGEKKGMNPETNTLPKQHTSSLQDGVVDFNEIWRNPLRLPCPAYVKQAMEKIEEIRAEGDSCGGVVSCIVTGLPPGLGEPVFDKLDARLGAAILSIGGCKGIEFGAGFAAAGYKGSKNNDEPIGSEGLPVQGAITPDIPAIGFKTNNSGGILGGISSGQQLFFKAAFKPPPSIGKPQKAVDKSGAIREITIEGRHDVCIAPRAVPVVEAMAALLLADFILMQRRSGTAVI